MFVSVILLSSYCYCQWAFVGGSLELNDPGKYSGNNLWPSGRASPGFAMDGKTFFLFGGYTIPQYYSDLWALNLETLEWNLLGPPSNDPTFQGSLTDQGKFSSDNWPSSSDFVSIFTGNDLLYMFPFYEGNDNNPKFFLYNKTSKQWFFDQFRIPHEIKFQYAFHQFNSFLDFKSNSFYLIGAEETIYLANMTSLNFEVYSNAKYSYPLVFCASAIEGDSIYIFGGQNVTRLSFNSFYKFNFTSHELVRLNQYNVSTTSESNFGSSGIFSRKYFPCGRIGSFMQINKRNNQLIVFGGYKHEYTLYYSDLWIFDLNSTSWAYLAGPTDPNVSLKYKKKGVPSIYNHPDGRLGGASLYDEDKRIFFIFGGFRYRGENEEDSLNDLWGYYFDIKPNRSSKLNSEALKGSHDTKTIESSKAAVNLSKLNNSFPAWALIVIIITGLIVLLVLVLSIAFTRKHSKLNENVIDLQSRTDSLQMETLINTNIGLSNHFSLLQEARQFANIKSLASGGQAEVCLVQVMNEKLVKELGSKRAVQKIFFQSSKAKEILLHEVSIMALLKKYPYFVSIYAYTLDPMSIVMKYYPDGSLDQWIRKNKLSSKQTLNFSFEIASALRTMHEHQLAHCDIKSQNILIEVCDRKPHCFLSDFGITQVLSDSILAVKAFSVINLKGLSIFYAAPESLSGLKAKKNWDNKKSDIYSYGCLSYEIITGKSPWEDIRKKIQE